ncbi:hypothetical protein BE04_15590 [Sorangium cellulosum]|uniref:Uncharacterized protein n=1 Tax=Sorangium cellulosum TaxID=56 RepID=A0A150PG43_SORCE|nr:hypothetical protein BE04_15590 [Sorangium cellulosum]
MVGLRLLRRSWDPTYRFRAVEWVFAAVVGVALSYAPLSHEDKLAVGLPFPIAYSSQHHGFRELASLGPIGLLSVVGNALFAREIWWLASRGTRAAKGRRQDAPASRRSPCPRRSRRVDSAHED